ncbi:uncharacterized protein LOC115358879 [Myripristis murdjan]|uniref:uncharacterized protein LOC115358879 n=1 Tax=Myripristis murdjan TaxID=586833 RepID=UPI001175CCF8|nr:uncharacterized protein LOC115358879 [Myripristis murdjan]
MTSGQLFLLVYLLASCWVTSSTERNETCIAQGTCPQVPDPTSHFLQCVGLPSTDTGKDHMRRLKGMIDASLDVYTFMRSSVAGVPIVIIEGAMALNPGADPFQNQALVHMWLEVKLKPLLRSITKQFLSCLSSKNFSCDTYQTVVKELSHHFSEMDPVRQKWIYTFFMYPFLSGEGVAGCVRPQESSEEWLIRNFGSFRAMARMKDFSTLNIVFSGLEVLHLLSPEQKAELLLRPEVAGLDNGTLSLVFHSLMTGSQGPRPTAIPGESHGWTSPHTYPPGESQPWTNPGYTHTYPPGESQPWTNPGYTHTYPPGLTHDSYLPPSPQHSLTEVVNGFMGAFRPIGSFVREFVSLTHKRNVSEIRSTTLTQALLNWTLAELASIYKPHNASVIPEGQEFDVTNVEDWYQRIVMPVLRRFLTDEQAMMHQNITQAFYHVFYLDFGMDNETSEVQDVCSITLEEKSCGLTNAIENVAHVLHCAARSNLTMSEETIMRLIMELTQRLNSLIQEFSTANFSEVVANFREVFGELDSPSLTRENLEDPHFIKQWFQIKLLPLLPDVPTSLLSCLSTKNFTCPVYQTLVAALSKHMQAMDSDLMYSHNIYEHFIFSFLQHHNTSDPQCISSANHTAEWLRKNFGFFSMFASVKDFYKLNSNFSGLEVLHLLSPKQIAELLVLPLHTPAEKQVIINRVFDYLLESPNDRRFVEALRHLLQLAKEVRPPCHVYKLILERLYRAVPGLPLEMEPATWAHINGLINIAPVECVPENITCEVTQFNGTAICHGVSSTELQHHLNTSVSMAVPCTFTLETYACAQLENFTANHLVSLLSCNLPGNSSRSKMVWKMLLTKLSSVLDRALDILASKPMPMIGSSALEVLDVIGEMRVSLLRDEQLTNSSVIRKWFSGRLRGFLSSASGRFLHCLSRRNLSCHSYQQILEAFHHQFDDMDLQQQQLVLRKLILPFLSQTGSDPGCVQSSNSSAHWLQRNLGRFSVLLSVRDLLDLNPGFSPLKVLQLLSPKQTAELLVLPNSVLPEKEVVINMLFDYLTESPKERKFSEFLSHLVMFAQEGNISCSSYKILFTRMDEAMPGVPLDIASDITNSKLALSQHIPPGCILTDGDCNVTPTNETITCVGVNSTLLQHHLDNGHMNGHFCNFSTEEYACASLSALTAEDLAAVLKCNRSSSSSSSKATVKLFLSKASVVLDAALDLLANMTFDPKDPTVSLVLDAIQEIRLDSFPVANFQDPAFIQLWFNHRLRPFLPAVSTDFLSCLSTKNLSCSTYQDIVQILSKHQSNMELSRQIQVYTRFIKIFLTRKNTTDPSCSLHTPDSGEWLEKNFGGFSVLVTFQELQMLHSNFSAMEALPQLTVRQLAEVSSTPGQLTSSAQVTMVTDHVPDKLLTVFFDDLSSVTTGHEELLPSEVRSAMLQVVFDRANLSSPSVGDPVVVDWFHNRLRPLLFHLSPQHVAPIFRIVQGRNCSTEQQAVEILNSILSALGDVTQKEIHNHIIQSLKGPVPLRCYGDNYNHSFYVFLKRSFMGFQFPNLSTFLSLMPDNNMHQLVNSMPPSDLRDFLHRHDVVDDDSKLCLLYNNYVLTPRFLETEPLPEEVQRPTLPCVWPMALSSTERSEVNAWFDRRLQHYLVFLTKNLLTSTATHNASCLAFQKLVSVLGKHNYSAADFMERDVFDIIKAYLASGTAPKCYNANNPELNSTAWFADYIGPFMYFLTLEDLNTFGSAEVIQVFTVNPLNIALLNHTVLPLNLTNYYTELIYLQNSNFNPMLLPLLCRCVAPGPAFSQLTVSQSMVILHNLTTHCTDLDPQIPAALAGNLGDNINAESIAALGSESAGMTTGQINMIKPEDLANSLNVLGAVNDWNQGQAMAIVQSMLSSGAIQINSATTLLTLGSLVMGVPAATYSSMSGSELLSASTSQIFLTHMMSAPQIIQHTLVTQIISVDNTSEKVIQNVPDDLATEIPRSLLLGFSSSDDSVIKKLNKKKWKRQQAVLFFDVVAGEVATAGLGNPNNLSSSVLQGFTCTKVTSLRKVHIKNLIKACRRKGRQKVILKETQLTCMYNYIKGESDVASYSLYPPDVLLYYDYSLVTQVACRSYFVELADADFSVFSSVLSYKRATLFANARSCLGITSTTLTEDNISVLGNMCCTLDGSYIMNSHSSILEKLKHCSDLTSVQAAATETLLLGGTTTYGAPSTWSEQTLDDLGILPLYLTETFYAEFNKKTKRKFLKFFLKFLRRNGVGRRKRRQLKRAIRRSLTKRSRRSVANECTVGMITQVVISDDTFPFDYDDVTQFNCCLSATIVKDNLAAITDKVDQEEYLTIVLMKLREAYSSHSSISEEKVQVLGPASRVATNDDINMWNITKIDTLCALMDSSDGEWDPDMAKAIISKYLSKAGNSLGSAELNCIGGANLCSLDTSVLSAITSDALSKADALTVSNCTLEKKKVLFPIAKVAFSGTTRSTIDGTTYQLMENYLGGADSEYIKSLSGSNVSMDMATFTSLDENVIQSLSVNEVRGLLGSNLAELKSYENETVVQNWITAQRQSELDKLNVGLSGGKADPTTTPGGTTTSSSGSGGGSVTTASSSGSGGGSVTTASSSGGSATSATTTGDGGARIRADTGLSFLLLLVVFITSQHILQ